MTARDRAPLRPRTLVGAAALLVALGGSIALALAHARAVGLAGCGPESACERLAAGPWGRVPGVGWPLSYLGAAWFAGLAAALLVDRGRPTPGLLGLVRLGALASLVLALVMAGEGLFCPWCAAVHAGNLVLAVALAPGGPGAARGRRSILAFGATFALASAALGLASAAREDSAERAAEDALASATAALAEGHARAGFTGRYVSGPADAPVHVVVFADYQCPDCRRIDGELRALVAAAGDVSFAPKHYPAGRVCNPRVAESGHDPHPRACAAAAAAEAAGIAGGAEAFFRAHAWLFERGGVFTPAELLAAAPRFGVERAAFERALSDPQAAARVSADVHEALELGLSGTPVVFVNGVELTGWNAPDALPRALEAARRGGSAGAPGALPPDAFERSYAAWREQPVVTPRPDLAPQALGAVEAPAVDVVLFGDLLDPNTRELDRRVRATVLGTEGARYRFRHFPFELACNPHVPRDGHPGACRAAALAEAAGVLGGVEGYWRAHALVIERGTADEAAIAGALGVDPQALAAAADSPAVQGAVRADADAGKALGLRSIPLLLIDGRALMRWKVEGAEIPERVIRAQR